MSRRKVLLLAGGLSLIIIGLGFCVPKPAPDSKAIFACLVPRDEPASDEAAKSERLATIEVEIRVLRLPIFSDDAKQGKRVRGVVTDLHRMFTAVQDNGRGFIAQFPRQTTLSGQPFSLGWCMMRSELAEDGVSNVNKLRGVKATGTATLLKNRSIHLHIELTDNSLVHDRLRDQIILAKASFVLEDQQTGFMGGLRRKNIDKSPYEVPLLSELPAIGSWFSIPREVEYEEEVLILATPKIIHAASK
jgi:hypothetical protein